MSQIENGGYSSCSEGPGGYVNRDDDRPGGFVGPREGGNSSRYINMIAGNGGSPLNITFRAGAWPRQGSLIFEFADGTEAMRIDPGNPPHLSVPEGIDVTEAAKAVIEGIQNALALHFPGWK